MRKIIIISALVFVGLIIHAQTTFYIDPVGSDATGNGTTSNPWKSLHKACAAVKTSGDIIHVNKGTYIENSQCNVPVGVSIEGASEAVPVINIGYAGGEHNGTISLKSTRGAIANGNQSISYIRLNGNNVSGVTAITSEYRHNVSIHHCAIENCNIYGIFFYDASSVDWWHSPSVFTYGNNVHNCTFHNVEHFFDGSEGFLFYNNICDNSTVDVKCLSSDHMKGWKIYNNTFSKAFAVTGWNFIFETYRYSDECEIYNNVFNETAYSLDISDVRNGSGTYGLKIHDNQFIRSALGPVNTEHGCHTLNIEGWGAVQGLHIYNNYFKNLPSGISIGSTNQHYNIYPDGIHWALDHIYIYYNIFENMGATNNQTSLAVWFWEWNLNDPQYPLNQVYDNIYICNNVFSTTTNTAYAFQSCFKSYWTLPVTNFHFDNNIIQNFTRIPECFIYSSNYSGVSVQKNLHWNNGSNSILWNTGTPSGTISNIPPANPLFVSSTNFHLTARSPAINAGIHLLEFTTDYSGVSVSNPPEVGAYEFIGAENHPPSIMDQSFQIDENSPNGTVIGTVVASDPDADQSLEYSLVSGNIRNGNGTFAINASTGVLSVANNSALNFDYALVVKVQDNTVGNLSSQATITINIVPTGIELSENNETIKVYPNPISDELIIEIKGNNDKLRFNILNSTGQIVFEGNLSGKTVVQTTNFSPGVYLMKLENRRSFEFKKIVKV